MAAERLIRVELVCALRDAQEVIALSVPAGTTVGEAIRVSEIGNRSEGIDVEAAPVGIYGRAVTRDVILNDGDRVEIYRPLTADPKQARRRRAAPRG
jgi:putative ubiquitin-RnfH superfamily antitoxin RatB of RatAB toxin-antitoxin module